MFQQLDAPFIERSHGRAAADMVGHGALEAVRAVCLVVIWLPAKLAPWLALVLTVSEALKAAQYWERHDALHTVLAVLAIPLSFLVVSGILRLQVWLRTAGRVWV